MNTMEITKLVGAFCGSLLVFLLISTVAHGIFNTHSETVAYSIPVEEEEAAGGEEEAAETVDVAALVAAADPAAGEGIFRRCASCHQVEAGANAVGPYLHAVVGRDIASAEGYEYSEALAAKEGAWTDAELYAFLADPKEYVPGTTMAFAGLSKSEDRANLIAWLATQTN